MTMMATSSSAGRHILIENDRIAAVGPGLAAEGNIEIIEASGRLVVPGLINAHYHSHDTLCRGFRGAAARMWLLYTLPMGQNRSIEEVRARTLVVRWSLRCGSPPCRTCSDDTPE
jgi:cytosine/adenosine deaminase-related metal-dependent hydrolase